MGQALDSLVGENTQSAFPNFTRGPEIEIATRQDVEHLKALLSQAKLNVSTQVLENSIVMPRDIMANHPGYSKIRDTLEIYPFKVDKKQKRPKRKKGEIDRGPENKELEPNDKGNYKVYDFGNYPLV